MHAYDILEHVLGVLSVILPIGVTIVLFRLYRESAEKRLSDLVSRRNPVCPPIPAQASRHGIRVGLRKAGLLAEKAFGNLPPPSSSRDHDCCGTHPPIAFAASSTGWFAPYRTHHRYPDGVVADRRHLTSVVPLPSPK